MNKLIILGSSRSDGDTKTVVNELVRISGWECIDLNSYRIDYYNYTNRYPLDDDFIKLMKEVLPRYDVLIFATPVYWYSMSGRMKVFFDRLTDLLEIEKDLGRTLRKKGMAALSCSVGNHLGENFWEPFTETAKYLGMKYLGNIHTITGNIDLEELEAFVKEVNKTDTTSG